MTIKNSKEYVCPDHTFWKDGNPPQCFNCGKTKEEIYKEAIWREAEQKVASKAYFEGLNANWGGDREIQLKHAREKALMEAVEAGEGLKCSEYISEHLSGALLANVHNSALSSYQSRIKGMMKDTKNAPCLKDSHIAKEDCSSIHLGHEEILSDLRSFLRKLKQNYND